MGRDSVFRTATPYGSDSPGSNPGRGEFSVPGAHPGPIQWYRALPGNKAVREWCQLPTPSSADVKERVELYLYSLLPSWQGLVSTLTLPLMSECS